MQPPDGIRMLMINGDAQHIRRSSMFFLHYKGITSF